MYIDLAGEWQISLKADGGEQSGIIQLPGILQAQGYGNPITRQTPWVSSLHDSYWYEQEEYKYAQEEQVNVPFLSQPPRHFMGEACYERKITVPEACGQDWHLHVELARWKSKVYIDGEEKGEDCTLCGPHDIVVGRLAQGEHVIRVVLDNSMIYPYRPDAHGVSDALGATWNGMAGEIALFTEDESRRRLLERKQYAESHKRTVEVKGNCFYIDGNPVYFRATHFGGEYPLTGYPSTDKEWWLKMMRVIKEWGLNGIRFHSYCPPDVAFEAADEEDIYLLVECGMWNHFEDTEDGEEMSAVLRSETRRILENFGHHPSFVFFSPSNEPGGRWYQPLRKWVSETREYDRKLGYGGRRIYTAQSGWPYDVPPAEVEGTDFIYFHRSGYGPFSGGTVRNPKGWGGRDYTPSLEGAAKPVVCHELGQICAYPNYDIIEKYKGYLQPGNYKVFRENARANGILPYAEKFVKCSGENQLRLYKEELEANFRTPELQGFELLDLHDYLGQGTALVGILDAFWENKGYGDPKEFREYCGDTVLLARFPSYVWKNTDKPTIPIEICHYGKESLADVVICWKLTAGAETLLSGEMTVGKVERGGNTKVGELALELESVKQSGELSLELLLFKKEQHLQSERPISVNHWTLYVFAKPETADTAQDAFLYTRDWKKAKQALSEGRKVVLNPYLSDLNYECPALSDRSVGWNAQMGPTWNRTMGIVVDEAHPIFRNFPTRQWGGWQWSDILRQGRGFHMTGLEQVTPIVQPIDDWNRNLLQGLLFEAKVLKGSLLMVTANLEGKFEDRPAAYTLKQDILRYAASEEFAPKVTADAEAIERKFFPILRMQELTDKVIYENNALVKGGDCIVQADPGSSVRIMQPDFPVSFTVELKKSVDISGILYVPEQRDRNHAGFVRDYRIEVRDGNEAWQLMAEGTFLNTCRSQQVVFDREVTGDTLRLTILSAYGCEDKYVYQETGKGWFKVFRPRNAVVQIAGLHVLCGEEATHGDSYAAVGEQKSKTKEIEL